MASNTSFNEEDYAVSGLHGSVGEQRDEAHYDDRSDADDDMEKGRIKFPKDKLYGREKEIERLMHVYGEVMHCNAEKESKEVAKMNGGDDGKCCPERGLDEERGLDACSGGPSKCFGSHVVFLSGYSGIGKSHLVREFINQIEQRYGSEKSLLNGAKKDSASPVLCATGKFSERSAAMAPFSGFSQAFAQLSLDLSKTKRREKREKHATKQRNLHQDESVKDTLMKLIEESDLISPGTEGNRILRGTFPVFNTLLDSCEASIVSNEDKATGGNRGNDDKKRSPMRRSSTKLKMSAMKETTREILSLIGQSVSKPFVLFLDDLQWADQASIEMLSFLLSDYFRGGLQNLVVICAFRSNEVGEDGEFFKLMEKVSKSREQAITQGESDVPFVEKFDLYSLSPEVIAKFVADCINKEEVDEVADLAEAVYQKTIGNIFFVKQALEELVRKNALYYDVMCFEWRWTVTKVELANYISDDVVETVKEKIRELPLDMQKMLIVMAFIPNAVDLSTLVELMKSVRNMANIGSMYEKGAMGSKASVESRCTNGTKPVSEPLKDINEATVATLLKAASKEGMILFSTATRESGNYVFAHDRIRQASFESISGDKRDDLLIKMSNTLLELANADDRDREWCFYIAVCHLNSVPSEKTDPIELARLNLQVSIIAKHRGALEKENEFLREGLKDLDSSGVMWKNYDLTLEFYNAIIPSEYSLGNRELAELRIQEVIKYGKTKEDKFVAYLHHMLCQGEITRDYKKGTEEGVKLLRLFGHRIPFAPTKRDMLRERVKYVMATRSRSFLNLADLPVQDTPILRVFHQAAIYSTYSQQPRLLKIVAWRAISLVFKQNSIDRHVPSIIVSLAILHAKKGRYKQACYLGSVAVRISERFPGEKELSAIVHFRTYAGVLGYSQSYSSTSEKFLTCFQDLKMSGNFEQALLSIMCYFYAFLAAGLPLNPLVESKLRLAEEYSIATGRETFTPIFQMLRQLMLNLRNDSDHPAELSGEAFHEKQSSESVGSSGRNMTSRDSSSTRLQLAFIYGDESIMEWALDNLSTYPLLDQLASRLHSRLCFFGLASFALGKHTGIGQQCLDYFEKLTKTGSVNARPVFYFIKAMKSPSQKSFEIAISACAEENLLHLGAMANEQCGIFLSKTKELEGLSGLFIKAAHSLYMEWGAYAKAAAMSKTYSFLKSVPRKTVR